MSDFNLHAPEGAAKKKRIVGRGQGSGRGTTAGRGNKGQQSRSGGKTYVGFEGGQMPLYRRLAHRGFSNYPFKKECLVVNLREIENHYADGETVDFPDASPASSGSEPLSFTRQGDCSRNIFRLMPVSDSMPAWSSLPSV